ncbi:hypothetical protein HY029_02165, partial [Candidatus Gottesmanbacteria bacterium]|nr:hypothetical protein [Candidatus Gottesmanbacteria bacterium]
MKNQSSKIKAQNLTNSLKLLTLDLVLIFALCTLHLRQAYAQSLSLSISPPLLEVMIKPGKSITQVYKLTNNGEPIVITTNVSELDSTGIKEGAGVNPDKWISILSNDIALGRPFL